jgi:hypothetical protein
MGQVSPFHGGTVLLQQSIGTITVATGLLYIQDSGTVVTWYCSSDVVAARSVAPHWARPDLVYCGTSVVRRLLWHHELLSNQKLSLTP